ncbi:molybdate-anion transporter-like isoform X2 [Ptychodera flava]|uniref:molybdate-anion transporter-like isoform X2 n=1 Tax=Ptychodera flava TaxID=63121 RepID=UPI003969E9A7
MVFIPSFYGLCLLCLILYVYTKTKVASSEDGSFRKFQATYLLVYLLATAGDWLQGPHVYVLYQSYGMTTHQIEILFVAGFGASMIFGTVIGSFADRYGRRANCILYGIMYGLACITKHFPNFHILMIGRLLGGTATSILFSAFESWLVYEHNARGFSSDLLSTVFSHATLGNSLAAIAAGLVAQVFADHFGYVAPFDVSFTVLMIMCFCIVTTWTENYGDVNVSVGTSMKSALKLIKEDRKVLCLGLIQSLFEGAMYTFVLEWTPALTPPDTGDSPAGMKVPEDEEEIHKNSIPHGWIFADFMVAVMIGSAIFKILCKYASPESFMRIVLFLSSISLLMPIIVPGNQALIFAGFIVFEICVGIFWPAMGTMRSMYVPEATRSTVMNLFRIPLNMIVIVILLQDLPMVIIFRCCVAFLLVACVAQQVLFSISAGKGTTNSRGESSPSIKQKKQPVTVV